jgi:hypothetical protein
MRKISRVAPSWRSPSNLVYALVHALLIATGLVLANLSKDAFVQGIAVALVGAGIAGYVVFGYVRLNTGSQERERLFASFGLAAAFSGRSVTMRAEYDDRLRDASEAIDVLGFGLSALRQDFGIDQLRSWAARCRVRVLLIDPEYPSRQNSIASIRDREEFDREGHIRDDVRTFVATMADLIHSPTGQFQVRLYQALPAVNIFRIDDDLFWGPYLIGQPSRNSPTFIVQRGGLLYKRMLDHFEVIWTDDRFSREVPADWFAST